MPEKEKVFFDTNILVYAHDSGSPGKQAKSRALLFHSLREGTGVISPQVLSEFFVTVYVHRIWLDCSRTAAILGAENFTTGRDAR